MEIKPVTSTIGAEIVDIDVRDLDDAGAAEIASAWARHGVIFLRDQHLSPEEHVAFAERFASIDVNQFFQAVDGHPKVAMVLKEPDQSKNIGGGWHTDHSYDEVPARGSILLAHEVPPAGGDTRFLSVAAAYEALSDGLKETLSTLQAHHSNEHIFGKQALKDRGYGDRLGNPEAVGGTIHPVVISHPDTGEKLLYVNPGFTTHFVGWTERESKALLGFLYEHITSPEFTIQFKWEPGSIAMWDNRSTWHWALNDYDGHRRLMHRITVSGVPLSAAA